MRGEPFVVAAFAAVIPGAMRLVSDTNPSGTFESGGSLVYTTTLAPWLAMMAGVLVVTAAIGCGAWERLGREAGGPAYP